MEERAETFEESSRMARKPKKRFKIRYFAGAATLILGATGIWAGVTGKIDLSAIKKMFGNKPNIDNIDSIGGTLPLDRDGIFNVSSPFGVKMLEKKEDDSEALVNSTGIETFYFLPSGDFDYYYLFDEENQVMLMEVTDDPRATGDVKYYQTVDGSRASGYIGVQHEYYEFLKAADDVKDIIATGDDKTYSTSLDPVQYDVANLYKVPAGYQLYSEDKSNYDYLDLAYVDYDETDSSKEKYSEIYSIPKEYVDDFLAVTEETYDLLTKSDEFKAQLIEAYDIYSQDMGNMGYEEPTNRGR